MQVQAQMKRHLVEVVQVELVLMQHHLQVAPVDLVFRLRLQVQQQIQLVLVH